MRVSTTKESMKKHKMIQKVTSAKPICYFHVLNYLVSRLESKLLLLTALHTVKLHNIVIMST